VNYDLYHKCGAPKCAPDPNAGAPNEAFDGAPCVPFTTEDNQTDFFCYDETRGAPSPVQLTDRCGDPFIAPVTITDDWAFYRIPFEDLYQTNYSFEAPYFALESIWGVHFSFAPGPVDFYIDDVGFYR
jgi:hypothetical protein